MLKYLRHMQKDDGGAAAIVIAIFLPVLFGFVGLAVDVGSWYNTERRMQMAADAAALSAAFEVSSGKTAAEAAIAALREAQKNGFTGAACDVNTNGANRCQVFNPPISNFAADAKAVEVILREPGQTYFSSMFLSQGPQIVGKTIMTASSGTGTYCVLALDGSAANALYLENNATVRCGVASNSSSATALNLENNATVHGNAYAVGTVKMKNNAVVDGDAYAAAVNKANNATISGSQTIETTPAMADPYAGFTPSSGDLTAGCVDGAGSQMMCKNNCTKQLNPGRYCFGWDVQNNATIELQSGVYVVETQLILKNNATIREAPGSSGGVTLILKGDYAMDVGNNALWDFAAPTSGTYAGIAFHSLKTNGSAFVQTFQNNATVKLTGAIYAPSQKVYFENNATVSETDCTQIVARLVDIRNNGNFGTGCSGKGTRTIGRGSSIKTMK